MTEQKLSKRAEKRIAQADETRRRALSPLRIFLRLAGIPLVTIGVAISVYVRTSDYPTQDAMRHLFALAGCEAAVAVGLTPATKGNIGYHARNDPDGDGVACDGPEYSRSVAVAPSNGGSPPQMTDGAKFVRP